MAHCFRNKETAVYCKYMKSVEVDPQDEHKIIERSETSLTSAWCTLHNCPCKDLDYHCSNIELIQGHWDDNDNWIEEPYNSLQ